MSSDFSSSGLPTSLVPTPLARLGAPQKSLFQQRLLRPPRLTTLVGVDPTSAGNRTIWGDRTTGYTDDSLSEICIVHAGLLEPGEAARVRILIYPGLSSYPGAERNGITSKPYGKWRATMHFEIIEYLGPADDSLKKISGTHTGSGDILEKHGTFDILTIKADPPDARGTIWGNPTDGYTNDSQKAKTVVHAGFLRPGQVGKIKFSFSPGHASYKGSLSYGIQSSDYGSWRTTMHLELVEIVDLCGEPPTPQAVAFLEKKEGEKVWPRGQEEEEEVSKKRTTSATVKKGLPESFFALRTVEAKISFITGIPVDDLTFPTSPLRALFVTGFRNDWRLALLGVREILQSSLLGSMPFLQQHEEAIRAQRAAIMNELIKEEEKIRKIVAACRSACCLSEEKALLRLSSHDWSVDAVRQRTVFKKSVALVDHPQLRDVLLSFLDETQVLSFRQVNSHSSLAIQSQWIDRGVDFIASLMFSRDTSSHTTFSSSAGVGYGVVAYQAGMRRVKQAQRLAPEFFLAEIRRRFNPSSLLSSSSSTGGTNSSSISPPAARSAAADRTPIFLQYPLDDSDSSRLVPGIEKAMGTTKDKPPSTLLFSNQGYKYHVIGEVLSSSVVLYAPVYLTPVSLSGTHYTSLSAEEIESVTGHLLDGAAVVVLSDKYRREGSAISTIISKEWCPKKAKIFTADQLQ